MAIVRAVRARAAVEGFDERILQSRRFLWFVSFMLFAAVAGAWALATPIDGAPDEASHVVRAASVARGEILGQQRAGADAYESTVSALRGL